jgi:DNA repair exonuclease SbcCD ATPase subunit
MMRLVTTWEIAMNESIDSMRVATQDEANARRAALTAATTAVTRKAAEVDKLDADHRREMSKVTVATDGAVMTLVGHAHDEPAAVSGRRLSEERGRLASLQEQEATLRADCAHLDALLDAPERAKATAARRKAHSAAAKKHDDSAEALQAKIADLERQRDDAGSAHAKQQRGMVAALLEKVGLVFGADDVPIAAMSTHAFDAAIVEIQRQQQSLRDRAEGERAAAAVAEKDEQGVKADVLELHVAGATAQLVEVMAEWVTVHEAAKGYKPAMPDVRALALAHVAALRSAEQ